ncbi:retina-specific copper amine oxidase-like [Dreissena polymorpha]|uniref:Amine oxidase n=1 Tax=Dreissena polymorpha TaxID=45954 RepID=A0A9D4IZJ3_DREPO|nr:retina-specific copper amine oxidase-like [Dreissena polymorpha]KAH3794166.1 hypothetical protein DPMN_147697 [Dreissena polymorpha]
MPSEETDLSDIDVMPYQNGTGHAPVEGVKSSGPWRASGSYSRKLKVTNSLTGDKRTEKNVTLLYVIIGIVLFVLGLAVGILIGNYAIRDDAKDDIVKYDESRGRPDLQSTPLPDLKSTTDVPSITHEQTTASLSSSSTSPCECSVSTHAPKPSTTGSSNTCNWCKYVNPDQSVGDEASKSPFAALTKNELDTVYRVLKARGYLSPSPTELKDNILSHMFLYPLEKQLVINFLDNGGPFPGRFAQVHVNRGGRAVPDIMEYKVGPLNVSDSEVIVTELRKDGEIPFNSRPYDKKEPLPMHEVLQSHLIAIDTLLAESFDGASFSNQQIGVSFYPLPSSSADDRLSGMYLYMNGKSYQTISMVPVSCIVHHPGPDSAAWYPSDFYYLGQGPFASGDEMQTAYNNGSLRKIKFPAGYMQRAEIFYLMQNKSLPERPLADVPPPRSYETKGSRYVIRGSRVTWLGWEFEVSSNIFMGPRIFDIRFKGQRIAYEISLQDITLIYSSQTNGAGPPALSDTGYLLGTYNRPRLGLDCPARSKTLSTYSFLHERTTSSQFACVFEADGQEPLWRHGQKGLADHYLVVRATMNLGNYDYTMEWRFHLDGSVETLLIASGFLYGSFWDPEDPLLKSDKSTTPFGYRIADYLIGPIHDHSFVIKVDLDILGTKNSFETIHWKSGQSVEAYQSHTNITQKPGYFFFNHTRYLVPEILEHEQGFTSNPLKPKYFTIVNENERNVWGVKRGYRVIPYSTMAENLPEEHLMFHAWNHLRNQVYVTRRKDEEQHGTASWYGLQHPVGATGGVGDALNNETIRNEDLVLWITEKFLHAPTSEDLPMTINVKSGFKLKPFNYFDRTPVFDVRAHYDQKSQPYPFQEPCYEV